MNSKFFTARNISFLAILMALVIVLQAFGGSINIGFVQLNFTLIPIVLGALLLGPLAGAILGFACGVVVLIQVIIAPAGFYFIIWTMSPVITILICIVKTTVAGFVAGLVFKILRKKNKYVAVFVSAGLVPIINTALFIIGCLFMNESIVTFQNQLSTLPDYAHVVGMNPFIFIILILVTFNFFFELALNLIVSPAIYRVIKIVDKSPYQDEDPILPEQKTQTETVDKRAGE